MAEEHKNEFFDEAPEEFREKSEDADWYVIHTYSGHENKVKINIENMVKNRGYIDEIYKVEVPKETYISETGGVRKEKERKIFPGYVFIKMVITDTTWYLVRNTRGVTGFVGPGSKPVPLSPDEVKSFGVTEKKVPVMDVAPGDKIQVVGGAFQNETGIVESVDPNKGVVKAVVSFFGRDTSVELEYSDIEVI